MFLSRSPFVLSSPIAIAHLAAPLALFLLLPHAFSLLFARALYLLLYVTFLPVSHTPSVLPAPVQNDTSSIF
jgi:hypothetical protein